MCLRQISVKCRSSSTTRCWSTAAWRTRTWSPGNHSLTSRCSSTKGNTSCRSARRTWPSATTTTRRSTCRPTSPPRTHNSISEPRTTQPSRPSLTSIQLRPNSTPTSTTRHLSTTTDQSPAPRAAWRRPASPRQASPLEAPNLSAEPITTTNQAEMGNWVIGNCKLIESTTITNYIW